MKRNAIIIDLDGTLIDTQEKVEEQNYSNTDWEDWIKSNLSSPVNEWCREIVKMFNQDPTVMILFVTGRDDSKTTVELTYLWLNKHLPFLGSNRSALFMRKYGDWREDHIVKQDIYDKYIEPNYNILFAIDDKQSNCEMWKRNNIPALYCGDF